MPLVYQNWKITDMKTDHNKRIFLFNIKFSFLTKNPFTRF